MKYTFFLLLLFLKTNLYSTQYKFFSIDSSVKVDTVTSDYIVINSSIEKLNLNSIPNTYEEIISKEKNVQRNGKNLILATQNGKKIAFTNNAGNPDIEFEDKDFIEYRFLGKFNSNYWIIGFFESNSSYFELINSENGEETNLNGFPICSSRNQKFIITYFVDGFEFYIELYELNSKYQLKQKIYLQEGIAIDKIGWVNNNIIVLKIKYLFKEDSQHKFILLKI